MRSLIRMGSCLAVSLMFLVASGYAQSVSDGTITGTVAMPNGESIRSVPVKITSPALVSGERNTVSDDQGRFVFLSLPPGTYSLSATLDGFKGFLGELRGVLVPFVQAELHSV